MQFIDRIRAPASAAAAAICLVCVPAHAAEPSPPETPAPAVAADSANSAAVLSTADLWGRNILNRKYYQPAVGFGSGVSSFDSSNTPATLGGYTSRVGAWAEPLTYGVNVRFEY
jgi:hypothetical protein